MTQYTDGKITLTFGAWLRDAEEAYGSGAFDGWTPVQIEEFILKGLTEVTP